MIWKINWSSHNIKRNARIRGGQDKLKGRWHSTDKNRASSISRSFSESEDISTFSISTDNSGIITWIGSSFIVLKIVLNDSWRRMISERLPARAAKFNGPVILM